MNALDLLHKIRTCDKRGHFKYSDAQMLNEIITYVQEREAQARQIALEQCASMADTGREISQAGAGLEFINESAFSDGIAKYIADGIRALK